MITSIPFIKSEALEKEINAQKKSWKLSGKNHEAYFKGFPSVRSYLEIISSPENMETVKLVNSLGRSLRVLDVGAGVGDTAIYLAAQGHSVSALEPALANCEFIDYASGIYGLNIDVYLCSAESIDKIKGKKFDVVIFNSSLHHCDDPLRALKNSFEVLSDGGVLLVSNEPILPFFRSKKRFYDNLIANPSETGNYGGNEHIYYYPEYKRMIKSVGFVNISASLNIRYTDWSLISGQLEHREILLKELAIKNNELVPAWEMRSKKRGFYKKTYYLFLFLIYKSGIIGSLLLSLIRELGLAQVSFTAKKERNL